MRSTPRCCRAQTSDTSLFAARLREVLSVPRSKETFRYSWRTESLPTAKLLARAALVEQLG